MPLVHDLDFDPRYGEAVAVAPGVARVTAENPGPFTFAGTNTYLVGEDELVVIDPGPDDPRHHAALLEAIGGRAVRRILLTHTHRDHSGGLARLVAATGAEVLAEGPHRPARPLAADEANPLDAAADTAFAPDTRLVHGSRIALAGGDALEAVATPGHAANHLAFAHAGSGVLFSGDHVMAWSTTIVAPPDGAMADYMASLDRLLARRDARYLPGHGGPVDNPAEYVAALKAHRLARERAILERLASGDTRIPEIVGRLYADVDPRLHGAAGLSVLAHLEDLVARGLVVVEPAPRIRARFALADRAGS